MDSVAFRKLLLTVILPLTVIIGLYGIFFTSNIGGVVLIALTSGLLLGIIAIDREDPHQINLTEEKSYRITLKSVLTTSLITGLFLAGLLYGTAEVIEALIRFWGYEPLSFQLFVDTVGRLDTFMQLPPSQFAAAYLGSALVAGLSFWILYPYLPTESEEVAGPVTFSLAWMYLISLVAIFLQPPQITPVALALDAALFAFWGHIFAIAYEDVEKYVP
ncbi:MAG: hypothetical protein MUP63_01020 [Candidatus Nanohaloarchaeota archaeon QJJ-7]|nr:hypothetical protein [Candidatus Nanohaloarchaeota archaeon QJJ-7]